MWNPGVLELLTPGKGIPYLDSAVIVQADNITGNCTISLRPLPGQESNSITDANFLAYTHVLHFHALFVSAGADTHEGHTISMTRIHIGLDLENKP